MELRTTTATNVNAGGLFDYGAGCNTVTANVFAGTSTRLRNNLTTTKTFIGNATSGVGGGAHGAQNNSTGTLIVVGNAIGSAVVGVAGIQNNSTGTINMTGNSTGGTTSSNYGIRNFAAGTVILTGNVFAGSAITTPGVINDVNGVVIINGTATASTISAGAINASNGTLTVTTAIASTAFSGVLGTLVTGTTIVRNVTNNANGCQGISGFVRFSNAGPNTFTVTRENGTTQTLVDASVGNPAITDVRSGVTYASGALTGTCAVPPAASVGFGVPVDNTTGTALFSPQDLFTAIANSSDPIAERLRNVSTTQIVGAIVASFDT